MSLGGIDGNPNRIIRLCSSAWVVLPLPLDITLGTETVSWPSFSKNPLIVPSLRPTCWLVPSSNTIEKFSSTFKDPFGDTIYILNEGKCEQKIKPGKVSNVRLFYYWDDNEYISDQPYDKLLSLVTNKTGTIETKIIAIVFEDGEVIKIDSK